MLAVTLPSHADAHWRGGVWVGPAPALPYGAPPLAYVPPPVIHTLPPPVAYLPYPYPDPVPRVRIPPHWTGWRWIPGHWRYD